MWFLSLFIIWVRLAEVRSRSWRDGPEVDPGVFVITLIKDCRNGAGYCILGNNCSVDVDFIPDDLGGHCRGLAAGFSPQASFVCCRQNPANIKDNENEKLEAIILENNIIGHESSENKSNNTSMIKPIKTSTPYPVQSTRIVTETVTELHTATEVVTKIEEITKVITNIITEFVTNTTPGWDDTSNTDTELGDTFGKKKKSLPQVSVTRTFNEEFNNKFF